MTEETQNEESLVRLNKFIANSGFAARRKVDELIESGRVSVNDMQIKKQGVKINPEKDVVKIDGEIVKNRLEYTYVLLNKPTGYITTTSDEFSRPKVTDLVNVKDRIYPVGRLDFDTEGFLLLTNDGDLANRLMHPKYRVYKSYIARIDKPINDKSIFKLRTGVIIDGKPTGKASVKATDAEKMELFISIHEGRNRQVRRMLESIGFFVRSLKRIEYAGLKDDNLKTGKWRFLDAKEVARLKRLTSDIE